MLESALSRSMIVCQGLGVADSGPYIVSAPFLLLLCLHGVFAFDMCTSLKAASVSNTRPKPLQPPSAATSKVSKLQ